MQENSLPEFILLGRGEEMMGGRKRDSIVSDALESLIGAMYLDGGFEPAQAFVMKFILNDLEDKRIFMTVRQCFRKWYRKAEIIRWNIVS